MSTQKIIPIVEGEGDVHAVPVLLRRILSFHNRHGIQILKPHRRGDIPKIKANFERFFEAAALENAAVLCVLDFDCALCKDVEQEEAQFREKAKTIRPDIAFDACFVVKEFESMFLWDPESTRAVLQSIPTQHVFPEDPESIRDAKGWLSNAQPKGHSYKPTAHQARLAAQLNLTLALNKSPSFQRLSQAVLNIIN